LIFGLSRRFQDVPLPPHYKMSRSPIKKLIATLISCHSATLYHPHETNPQLLAARRCIRPGPVLTGRPARAGVTSVTASPSNLFFTSFWSYRVNQSPQGVAPVPIQAPLPYIAVHIIDPPIVGIFLTDAMQSAFGISPVPSHEVKIRVVVFNRTRTVTCDTVIGSINRPCFNVPGLQRPLCCLPGRHTPTLLQ